MVHKFILNEYCGGCGYIFTFLRLDWTVWILCFSEVRRSRRISHWGSLNVRWTELLYEGGERSGERRGERRGRERRGREEGREEQRRKGGERGR